MFYALNPKQDLKKSKADLTFANIPICQVHSPRWTEARSDFRAQQVGVAHLEPPEAGGGAQGGSDGRWDLKMVDFWDELWSILMILMVNNH